MNIYCSDEDNRLSDDLLNLMHRAAETALESEFGKQLKDEGLNVNELPIGLSVSIVDGDCIKELNNSFRGIDRVTDVLSFPQYADAEELLEELEDYAADDCDDEFFSTVLGDVVICYDKAIEQAEEFGTGITRELVYLFVHSIFHLLGYDHETDDERCEMRAKEEDVLSAIGVTR